MVRRGSPVRVRKRALSPRNTCKSASSVVSTSIAEHIPFASGQCPHSRRRAQSACKSSCCPARRSTSLSWRVSALEGRQTAPKRAANPQHSSAPMAASGTWGHILGTPRARRGASRWALGSATWRLLAVTSGGRLFSMRVCLRELLAARVAWGSAAGVSSPPPPGEAGRDDPQPGRRRRRQR